MGEVVQANYEELERVAQLFQTHADLIEQMKGRLRGGSEELAGGGWEGRGSDAFQQEMEGMVFPATTRLHEALSEANRTTLIIVQIMQDAEEEASAPFRGGDGGVGPGPGTSTGQPAGGGGGTGSGPGRSSYLFGYIELSDSPKPSRNLSTAEKVLVTGLGVVSVGADVLATFVSGAGIVVEGGAAAADGPAPVGEAVGLAAYYVAMKPWETGISLVGIGATGLSDIIQGNTYISGSELVVGQDTLVAGGAFVGSLPLEGVTSTAVNVGMLGYDTASLLGYSPTIAGHRWEYRFGGMPPRGYFVGYPPGN